MRILTSWNLWTLLIISASMSLMPILVGSVVDQVAFASDQNRADVLDNGDQDDGEGDRDRGHGNDKVGVDEDNPGRGRGNSPEIGTAGGYTVETECKFDDDDNITKCTFSGVAPDDGSDAGRITVPNDAVCAKVLGGDFVFVDPDSGASVPGYASEEDDHKLKLELHGEVTTTGTMTYWIATIGSVVPAEGLALHCTQEPRAALDLGQTATTPSPTSTPEVTTGTLVVVTYACDDVPADTSAFDWFGQCAPSTDPRGFTLTPVDATTALRVRVAETDAIGEAGFDTIDPGIYELQPVDASWCHAKSDRVNGEGEVVIQAGVLATVWTFYCDAGKG